MCIEDSNESAENRLFGIKTIERERLRLKKD